MKRFSLILALFILCNHIAAQIDSSHAIKVGWGTLDYAIPESPAFKLLGSNPDNILKPTSVRTVALSVGNYFLSSGSTIPKSLAVEISPLLFNGNVSLYDYNKNKFWYRFRFSLGTSTLSNGGYGVAEGIRFTIVDRSDLRTDKELDVFFGQYLQKDAEAKSKAIALYAAQNDINTNDVFRKLGDEEHPDTVLQNRIKKISLQFLSDRFADPSALSAYRARRKQELWNASIWEVGAAALQTSSDSLVKNLHLSQVGFWSTAGFPLGKKGQLLFGAKLGIIDSVQWNTNVSLGERIFYGSNSLRAFLQTQYEYKNNMNNFTGSIGCQFNILNGIWGDFSINIVVDGNGKLSYRPGFSIALANPEQK